MTAYLMTYRPHDNKLIHSTAGTKPFRIVSDSIEKLQVEAQKRSESPLTWSPAMNQNRKNGLVTLTEDTSGERFTGRVDFDDKGGAFDNYGVFNIEPVEAV